ncbi:hypothetical protein HO173_007343 [Letharia columbiana]|uniref:Uncharacterized protein n=1 Tax=Letharia columbiana TaxID=112416 RepID=A0A8H6L408_9LECA|nr:uncharacterized protein HO173_007343 [Letharia columbiana]KAF6234717.1 hypothetical protein HO173_007343 [Letharia columbiana]
MPGSVQHASSASASHEAVLSNYVPQLQQLLRTIVITRSDYSTIGGELDSLEALDNLLAIYALDKNAGANPISNATYHYQRPEALPSPPAMCNRSPHPSSRSSWAGRTVSSHPTSLMSCATLKATAGSFPKAAPTTT